MNTEFVMLDNTELDNVNGGLIGEIIVGAIIVVGTLVGDHMLEKETGRDAVEWAGYGMTKAGQKLQEWGQTLMQ